MTDQHETPTPEQPPEPGPIALDTLADLAAAYDRQSHAFEAWIARERHLRATHAATLQQLRDLAQWCTTWQTLAGADVATSLRTIVAVATDAAGRTPTPYDTDAPPCPTCGATGLCSCTRLS